jgi:hypothetical protein
LEVRSSITSLTLLVESILQSAARVPRPGRAVSDSVEA